MKRSDILVYSVITLCIVFLMPTMTFADEKHNVTLMDIYGNNIYLTSFSMNYDSQKFVAAKLGDSEIRIPFDKIASIDFIDNYNITAPKKSKECWRIKVMFRDNTSQNFLYLNWAKSTKARWSKKPWAYCWGKSKFGNYRIRHGSVKKIVFHFEKGKIN